MGDNAANLEIGQSLLCAGVQTNYHDVGEGGVEPVLLLHGSGPGVSAWANWRLTLAALQDDYRLLAPDLAGFGYSQVPAGYQYSRDNWLQQVLALLDGLQVSKVNVIGNSFGGSMALALCIAAPERVNKLILMGSVGVPFTLTPGLEAVWGYEPSLENMRAIMKIFAYDQNLIGEDLVALRYQASTRAGVQEAFAQMFPAPRQRWVEAMSHPEADIRRIKQSTLLIHGRDDQVIPLETSLRLNQLIEDSQLHVFGRCGHWTQIEHASAFTRLVSEFLAHDNL